MSVVSSPVRKECLFHLTMLVNYILTVESGCTVIFKKTPVASC